MQYDILFIVFLLILVVLGILLAWKLKLHLIARTSYIEHFGATALPIKISTCNVKYLTHMSKDISAFKPLLANNDIIFFQEWFNGINSDKIHELTTLCKDMKYNFITSSAPKFDSRKFVDSGLVIASRFPLHNVEFKSFADASHVDAFADKGILYCEIQVNGMALGLFNTHLQSRYVDSYDINDIQKTQINNIKDAIQEKQPNKFILGGDFNIDILNPKHLKFVQTEFNKYNLIQTNKTTMRNSTAENDYFITNIDNVKLVGQLHITESDHCGVSIIISEI